MVFNWLIYQRVRTRLMRNRLKLLYNTKWGAKGFWCCKASWPSTNYRLVQKSPNAHGFTVCFRDPAIVIRFTTVTSDPTVFPYTSGRAIFDLARSLTCGILKNITSATCKLYKNCLLYNSTNWCFAAWRVLMRLPWRPPPQRENNVLLFVCFLNSILAVHKSDVLQKWPTSGWQYLYRAYGNLLPLSIITLYCSINFCVKRETFWNNIARRTSVTISLLSCSNIINVLLSIFIKPFFKRGLICGALSFVIPLMFIVLVITFTLYLCRIQTVFPDWM